MNTGITLPAELRALWGGLAVVAVAIPALLAFNLPPSATLLNQAAAPIGWSAWLIVLAAALPVGFVRSLDGGLAALLCAIGTLVAAAVISPLWTGVPSTLSLSPAGMLAVTALVATTAAMTRRIDQGHPAFEAFCVAILIAGALSSLIGIVQVFAPHWADGNWIASTSTVGRAVGNLRQPNHLGTLLLLSMVAAIWLGESTLPKRVVTESVLLLFLFGLALTASRTGVVGVLLLAAWSLLDKRLATRTRGLLVAAPFIYALYWAGLSLWARSEQKVFIGELRLTGDGDISSERFAIWTNTLTLIERYPWFGVGFGEFNFAWTLTPFPDRPRQFFDHAHNLPLHLIAELGIPLGTLVLALLAFALWRAFAASRAATGLEAITLRCAFMMVLIMALHSLLEYPLWYAYFLLPTALVFGMCLGRAPGAPPVERKPVPGRTRPLLIAGMLVMLGGFVTIYDYLRVVPIFAPREGAPPLAERIANGQRSWFFAHHADYAAATTAEHPSQVMKSFDRATHYLLDARLMMAWSRALAEAGDLERARHVAQRLREFHHPQAKDFFAVCDAPPGAAPRPFQCVAPTKLFDHRDFR